MKTTTAETPYFDFERMDVYRVSRDHLELVAKLETHPKLRDQLDRASDSILLNIAEGMGKPKGSKDRAKFFRIALGSAKEAACAWEVLCIRRIVLRDSASRARAMLSRVVAMLSRMT
jgi:four helix bundle protein